MLAFCSVPKLPGQCVGGVRQVRAADLESGAAGKESEARTVASDSAWKEKADHSHQQRKLDFSRVYLLSVLSS